MGLDNNANTSKCTYSKIGCFLFVLAINVFFKPYSVLNLVLFESSTVQNIMQSHIFIPLRVSFRILLTCLQGRWQ